MPELTSEVGRLALVIEIGGVPDRVNTTDPVFRGRLQDHYAGFVTSSERAGIEFDVDLTPPCTTDPNAEGAENRIEPIPAGEAARILLCYLLFFAEHEELVRSIFHSAFEFVSRVPVFRLTFVPKLRGWELIG